MSMSPTAQALAMLWYQRNRALFVEVTPAPVAVADLVADYLNGAGRNMNINGLATPTVFSYQVPTGRNLHMNSLLIYIQGVSDFDTSTFGDIPTLANGIDVAVDGNIIDNWKSNIEVAIKSLDAPDIGVRFNKAGKSMALAYDSTTMTGGRPLLVEQSFSLAINDNLSALTFFYGNVQGVLVDE